MNTMKKIILAVLGIWPLFAHSQEIYTMKFLPQLAQSQWSNATNESDNNLSIGLPVISGTSFYFYNSGFTYNDLFKKVNDSTTAIHPGQFINGLKTNNYLSLGVNVSLFSISMKLPKGFTAGFSVNDRADVMFSYPKAFLSLLWYGNGPDIGKSVDVGNFGLNATWYREYAVHINKQYGKWTFGASPKLLFGKTNINTKESSFKLYTDTGYYALTGTANMNVQTSGMHDSDNQNQFNSASNYIFNSQNKGLAIDLGAKYEINDKFSVAAGVNDLGYIHWKSAIYNYTANSSFTFNGFDASGYFQGDSNIISSQKLTDSVSNLVKFNNNVSSYTTYLPYNLYGMGFFKLRKQVIGLELSAERFNKTYLYAATASYQINLGRHFTADLTYTAKTATPFNIGGALIFQFLHLQLYFVTDNWWAPIDPLNSKNVNLQFGMNLVFGHKKKPATTETTNGGDTNANAGGEAK